MEEVKEINSIIFGISSTEDMRKKSVYVANVSKYTESRMNTVYDHRSGSLFNKKCETCKQCEQQCPGHFGIIELNAVIVHPIFFTHVFNILKIICHYCSRLLITREHLEFSNILRFDGERKLAEIVKKIKKFHKCFYCNTLKREYKIKKDCVTNIILYDENNTEISDDEIMKIFSDIDKDTLDILGMSHPKNCCLEVFPVIPPCCRPYEFIGNNIKEDDLTKQLVEIIKANNNIPTSTDKKYAIHNLKLKIETFCRNPKKFKNINSEPIKGIRERLTGKDGQLRDNLMGKRTEMCARTVIGPGPNLKLNQVGIPEAIAKSITFPINVYKSNINSVYDLIERGYIEKIKRGDNIIQLNVQIFKHIMSLLKPGDIIKRNGKNIQVVDCKIKLYKDDKIFRNGKDITPEKLPELVKPEILLGDIAQRRILDGDWVLLNRQPTLHKGSMMAFQVVVCGSKTFTFNLAVCKAFNSDFDGDEKNAHFPQSIEASIELQLLSTPEECLCSSSDGTPIIVILQDSLLGAYLMSSERSLVVSENIYNDILMCMSRTVNFFLKRKEEIKKTLQSLNLYKDESSLRTGRALLSLILPKTFNYYSDDLTVKNGVIIEGRLTKKYLGSTKTSFIYLFKMEYGKGVCVDFINDIQYMTNKWLTYNSFSINMSDCFQNSISTSVIRHKLLESNLVQNTILDKKLAEAKINIILSNAKDIGMQIAEDDDNNIVQTIKAGSKGDFFNLGQVKGLLGQQLINGKRIEKQMDNGTRTLVHYPRNRVLSLEEKYESRGFIMNSFYKGLNPKEFFFHSMSGRQGVCDTAMTTYMSGYNMRKLVKLTEDIKIQNDCTVADSSGNLYSFAYGEMGLNPESKNVDVSRIIDSLESVEL